MIVKNEQSILERCLTSYAGTYDELIIVDTGSTDSTKDIAHFITFLKCFALSLKILFYKLNYKALQQ